MAEGNEEKRPPFPEDCLNQETNPVEKSNSDESHTLPSVNQNVAPTKSGTIRNESNRREENPFSFKHFIKNDSGNKCRTGAKPKIYENIPSPDHVELDDEDKNYNENSFSKKNCRHLVASDLTSVLPDFVQDHILVEHCYLNNGGNSDPGNMQVDLDNLPDFAINNSIITETLNSDDDDGGLRAWANDNSKNRSRFNDNTFDLNSSVRDRGVEGNESDNNAWSTYRSEPRHIPFDLPNIGTNSNTGNNDILPSTRTYPQLNDVGSSKSLPDFLSDGPIHSERLNDFSSKIDGNNSAINGRSPSPEQPHMLSLENERLRIELNKYRRLLEEERRRLQEAERQLTLIRSKDHEETATLEKAIENVEDNLKRTTMRAVNAENLVSKLKKEISFLKTELSQVKKENQEYLLASGASCSSAVDSNEIESQILAKEIRAAATSAEKSLRQLLNGVGSLKIIASKLEGFNRIHDQTDDFISDFNEDAGPAL